MTIKIYRLYIQECGLQSVLENHTVGLTPSAEQGVKVQVRLGGGEVNLNLLYLPEVQFLWLLRDFSKSNQMLKAFMDLKKRRYY